MQKTLRHSAPIPGAITGVDPPACAQKESEHEIVRDARSIHTSKKKKKLLIAGLAVTTAVLAGCGSSGGDGDGGQVGSDDHAHIDPYDPAHLDEVGTATTAMQVILSWQPAVDESKSDALRRARPWLGGDLLATVDNDIGGAADVRPDRDWAAWKESGDALTASCTKAESTPAAPEGMRTVVIDVSCGQTVLHAAGSSTNLAEQTWRTTVTRTDDGWRLTDFRYQ